MAQHIVLLGHDPTLLDTRRWLLEQEGYSISDMVSLPMLEEQVSLRHIDLLLLCHTLSLHEMLAAARLAATVQPPIPLLLMTITRPPESLEQRHAICNTFDGPSALIVSVQRLLSRS